MKWFRLYDEIIDDPKIMLLEEKYRWRYIAILCLINRYERSTNRLRIDKELTFHLRLTQDDIDKTIDVLLKVKLLQKNKHGIFCKAFKNRQFESDNSYKYVKHFRNISGNISKSLHEMPPDTDTDTDTEKKKIIKRKKIFIKPSIEEIRDYTAENFPELDAEEFYHYYESKNWMVGKSKMISWKSAVITWKKKYHKEKKSDVPYHYEIKDHYEPWENEPPVDV